jgi:hypothetical protein
VKTCEGETKDHAFFSVFWKCFENHDEPFGAPRRLSVRSIERRYMKIVNYVNYISLYHDKKHEEQLRYSLQDVPSSPISVGSTPEKERE